VIGICTDSQSMVPPELVERFGIEVVPMTVTIGDREYLEGVDIDADAYYELLETSSGIAAVPAQPSSGQFALAYERLIARGARQIMSIHSSAGIAGTLSSARLATRSAETPVKLVDAGSASFAVSCAVWAAAEAIADGAELCQAASAAEQASRAVGNLFVLATAPSCGAGHGTFPDHFPLLRLSEGRVRVVSQVDSLANAAVLIAAEVTSADGRINVLLAHADYCAMSLVDDVEHRIRSAPNVRQIQRTRVGPSVAPSTSNCGAGVFYFAAD
jgi:fatty acid-binding protein DegV